MSEEQEAQTISPQMYTNMLQIADGQQDGLFSNDCFSGVGEDDGKGVDKSVFVTKVELYFVEELQKLASHRRTLSEPKMRSRKNNPKQNVNFVVVPAFRRPPPIGGSPMSSPDFPPALQANERHPSPLTLRAPGSPAINGNCFSPRGFPDSPRASQFAVNPEIATIVSSGSRPFSKTGGDDGKPLPSRRPSGCQLLARSASNSSMLSSASTDTQSPTLCFDTRASAPVPSMDLRKAMCKASSFGSSYSKMTAGLLYTDAAHLVVD
eukprot:CAMPEP_0181293298 /NCGR_PEP_ID=MMETSP1101-20121128/2990_1 /TAXON_ID=46948 /ORGANISM="Rhodomonas abbreviata, Strain Caron Lab Isolate" /LENGTH=264 /DNA_ID=CAMNT_0023397875 /DNA_START=132 /DNA_END=926 /DNA_ORIENTATION=+